MTSLISRISAGIAVSLYIFAIVTSVSSAQESSPEPGAVGSPALAFTAAGTDGSTYSLNEQLQQSDFVILEWFNPDCPYVVKYHSADSSNTSREEAVDFARKNDVAWLLINSNAPGKQGSGLERNKRAIREYAIEVPVLLDDSGEIGQAYGATNTPQIYLINRAGRILYNGGIDDTVLNTDDPGTNFVIEILSQALAGKPVDPATTPHPGCSVKYIR